MSYPPWQDPTGWLWAKTPARTSRFLNAAALTLVEKNVQGLVFDRDVQGNIKAIIVVPVNPNVADPIGVGTSLVDEKGNTWNGVITQDGAANTAAGTQAVGLIAKDASNSVQRWLDAINSPGDTDTAGLARNYLRTFSLNVAADLSGPQPIRQMAGKLDNTVTGATPQNLVAAVTSKKTRIFDAVIGGTLGGLYTLSDSGATFFNVYLPINSSISIHFGFQGKLQPTAGAAIVLTGPATSSVAGWCSNNAGE